MYLNFLFGSGQFRNSRGSPRSLLRNVERKKEGIAFSRVINMIGGKSKIKYD
jgi:hypothetical protein